MNNIVFIFPFLTVLGVLLFYSYYFSACRTRTEGAEWINEYVKWDDMPAYGIYPMTKRDVLAAALITAVYAVIAFWGLGDMQAPESFLRFENAEETVSITLSESVNIGSVMYYTGITDGEYRLQFSKDGVSWIEQDEMPQKYSELLKWQYAKLNVFNEEVQYITVSASRKGMYLGEMALYDEEGNLIKNFSYDEKFEALFDEQDKIPEEPTYMNSAYFDEIYHARTAYEFYVGEQPYEVSHPPLGKIFIMLGISIFGMNPFGWRFMGTLFGILMLPLLYILLKNMFGKTVIASCGTTIFAFDFMHFVQTRIATIDSYGVFFILAMYLFMYRYIRKDPELPFAETAFPLFMSGLFFGLGCASKWIVVYGGLGLAVLYTVSLIKRGKHCAENKKTREFAVFLVKTLLFSVLSFIIVPAIIYCLSYIPFGLAENMENMLTNPDYYDIILANQKFMFSYHSGLEATHPYSAQWWKWVLDIRPILYYLKYYDGNMKAAFASFNSPLVCWAGIGAVAAMIYQLIKKHDPNALFVLVGYFSQLAPWMLISRVVFAYHYFPSSLFLVIAISHVLNTLWEKKERHYKLVTFGFTAACIGLFVLFYPVLTGITVPQSFTSLFLRWLTSWPV